MSDIYHKLESDMPVLLATGVVTKSQSERLLAHYRIESESSKNSKLVPILSIIGSVFVGVGFILYFAANWDTFSNYGKLALLLGTMAVSSMAAYVLLFVREYPKTGHAMALLASLLYGSSIFLVGQTFNLGGTFPQALLLWLLGILPMAYVTGLSSFPTLVSLLFGIWLISDWGERTSFSYQSPSEVAFWFLLAVGTFLSGIAVWHKGAYEFFAKTYARFGIFALFSATFLFTFQGFQQDIQGWSEPLWIFAALTAIGAASYLAFIFFRKKMPAKIEAFPVVHVLLLFAFWFAASRFFPESSDTYYRYRESGIFSLPAMAALSLVFANAYFVIAMVVSAAIGVMRKDGFLLNLSLAFVTVFVFAKYFDWFFEMMDRAVFFIVGGTLFVLVGWQIERRRKALIRTISQ